MPVPTNERLDALDAFRGITIAGMILVNNPGSWSYVYPPLRHAVWHGYTPTDLIFPFFLFIVGVSMRFSFRRFKFTADPVLLRKIFWRTVSIFLVGVLLHAYPFIRQDWDWSSFRIMGVLQRIALCYGLGAILVLYLSPRKQLWAGIAVLIGYWIAMGLLGDYTLEGNLARKIDAALLGEAHLWRGTGIAFDPEGLLSTFPAIVTVLLGYTMGRMIDEAPDLGSVLPRFIIGGVVLLLAGTVWDFLFPINKQLWTSSFVLVTSGWAVLILAFFLWAIDVRKWKRPAWPFIVYGMNALFVYVISGLWVKTIIRIRFEMSGESVSGYTYLYETVFRSFGGDYPGSLLFALATVFGIWLLAFWMYRKKLFVKI